MVASSDWFISPGAWMGPSACASRSGARPSQKSGSIHARLRMVGVRRPTSFMPCPMPFGSPSPHENAGLWQVAQEMKLELDSRGSKNSVRPSSSRSRVKPFSFGNGTVAGRRYFAFSSSMALSGGFTIACCPRAGATLSPMTTARIRVARILRPRADIMTLSSQARRWTQSPGDHLIGKPSSGLELNPTIACRGQVWCRMERVTHWRFSHVRCRVGRSRWRGAGTGLPGLRPGRGRRSQTPRPSHLT